MPAKVLAIRQNTPTGATFITAVVISIIMSLNWLKKLATVETLLPMDASRIPVNRANTMTGSISPFASELNIFLGMIFSSVSAKLMVVVSTAAEVSDTVSCIPKPGLIREATESARHTASAVVIR